jgi:hypothetical protein
MINQTQKCLFHPEAVPRTEAVHLGYTVKDEKKSIAFMKK